MERGSLYAFLVLSSILLIHSAEGFRRRLPSISIDQKSLDDLITPIIIGAMLGHSHTKAKSRSKAKKELDQEASAQHQQPVFLPMPNWQQYPRRPLVQQPPYHAPVVPMMQPLPPAPFHMHPLARHPIPYQHTHPVPVAVIPHELVPFLYDQLLANILEQAASTEIPVRSRRHHGQRQMATVQTFEFIEKHPIHQIWFPPQPHSNFHRFNYRA